ncbi:hypothetical protein [Halalkalicoccus paucihalophilus]|uniref:hypothetical protein n=1 Tax=Halalkalicoccus paucihalophilus TaxID=1008153 RepID=UPI00082A90C5|nr:hypothetical protein [Halalkalicoccus paucihalophilus]
MKSGASDPFAEESQSSETNAENEGESDESVTTAAGRRSGTEQEYTGDSEQNREEIEATKVDNQEREFSRDQLPYILRRDKVKDERPEVHQLFVQEETHAAAISAERDLEDRINDDLSRTDAREAIYRAGMQHLDDAEEILRHWGYDF